MNDSRRAQIRDILAAHAELPMDVATLSDEADLFQAGMASFASVNVMLGLEAAFDIEFADEMLTRDVFRSVASIDTAVGSLADQ